MGLSAAGRETPSPAHGSRHRAHGFGSIDSGKHSCLLCNILGYCPQTRSMIQLTPNPNAGVFFLMLLNPIATPVPDLTDVAGVLEPHCRTRKCAEQHEGHLGVSYQCWPYRLLASSDRLATVVRLTRHMVSCSGQQSSDSAADTLTSQPLAVTLPLGWQTLGFGLRVCLESESPQSFLGSERYDADGNELTNVTFDEPMELTLQGTPSPEAHRHLALVMWLY